MAFDKRFLTPIGGTARGGRTSITDPEKNAKSYWSYGSPDDLGTISAAGYFNEVRDLLNIWDTILIGSSSKNLRWTFIFSANNTPAIDDVTISLMGLTAT